ncbi:autotransporter assembly complex protein TamA [Consotaella aegiceratis]|uniref:autotransporter assembly complex protein TamA n=1 Tax=Consotaella aegiceratis TaxID=3097961 RepID=UPI002F4052EA
MSLLTNNSSVLAALVRGRGLASAVLAALILSGVPQPANAFELFGMKFFEKDEAEEVLEPVDYTVTLTVQPDEEGLRDTLEDASSLVADEDDPVSGSLGLLSKARNDRKRLVAALYENARYDGVVHILIDGQDIDDLAPDATFDTSRPVPVGIFIDPGQKYVLGAVDITANGVPIDPEPYELEPGMDASSVRVLDAEAHVLEDLRNEGRPFVAIVERDVIADAATGRLDYQIAISPGERVPFGTTYVKGNKAVDPGFIAYMADIEPGETFSPEVIDAARQRLLKLGVFSSVTVKEGQATDADGTLPVQIEVGERKFRYFGVGATYSSTEGAGIEGYWGHRNLFGRAESLRLDASVSRIGATDRNDETNFDPGEIDYQASAVFRKPGVLGPDSVYVGSIEGLIEHPLAYDRSSIAVTSGVEYDLTPTQKVAVSIKGEYEEITDYLGTQDYLIASLPMTYTFDNRDAPLNPTEGFYAKLMAEPSFDFEGSVPYVETRADVASYLSLNETDRFIVAGRLGYGMIFGADLEDVPNDRRFYAGGGGSVRGYGFQSISPYYPEEAAPGFNEEFEDTPTGGLSLFEASAELRIGITDHLQIVPFVDAGAVGDDLVPDFSEMKIGVGVGARYLTSFGPIRIDVGMPLDQGPHDDSFAIYAGIGQAF